MNLLPWLGPWTRVVRALAVVLAGACGSAHAADYFPPPDAQGGWRTLQGPTKIRRLAGMDLATLERAYEVTQRGTQNGGLLVVRHGYLVLEKYFGRAGRNVNPDMASTGKAYTSIACGIMLQEFRDRIPDGLDTHVFTPKYLPEAFPLDDPRRAEITLGQLLCMSAGYHGEGTSPGMVKGVVVPLTPVPGQDIRDLDGSSLRTVMWTNAGAGYSYSSPAPHIASMVLRRVTGKDLAEYIDERLARPMGWGPWGYCIHRGDFTLPHVNGAGSIAVHATDALRFGYCLLHEGRWGRRQLVPAVLNRMLWVALVGRVIHCVEIGSFSCTAIKSFLLVIPFHFISTSVCPMAPPKFEPGPSKMSFDGANSRIATLSEAVKS